MTASEQNLYDFYGEVGKFPGITLKKEMDYSLILGDAGSWPRVVYQFENGNGLPEILLKALAGLNNPVDFPLAVINRQLVSEGVTDAMRKISAFPVELWELMEAVGTESFPIQLSENQYVEKIKGRDGIEEFAHIVNQYMLGQVKVKDTLLFEMSESAGFDFFCLRVNGQMVTTLLSFSVARISGLYFIVTRPECRGKGYAGTLIRYVLEFLFMQGKEKVVLQADRKAVPLYLRTGFIPAGQLVLIKKI